jgi:hypothetical protein
MNKRKSIAILTAFFITIAAVLYIYMLHPFLPSSEVELSLPTPMPSASPVPRLPEDLALPAPSVPVEDLASPEEAELPAPSVPVDDLAPPEEAELPAPPAPTSAIPHVSFAAELDEALKKLVDANIAFQVPTKMKLSKPERVSISLGVSQSREELESLVRKSLRTGTVNFVVESSPLKVSNRMAAELTGVNFDIAPAGSQTQYISAVEPTNWTWHVKAKSEGDQILDLTLSAIVQIDEKETTRKINTFHHNITVEVTGCEDITSCFKQAKEIVTDSKEIFAGTLIPIGGVLIAWFRKRRHYAVSERRVFSEKSGTHPQE